MRSPPSANLVTMYVNWLWRKDSISEITFLLFWHSIIASTSQMWFYFFSWRYFECSIFFIATCSPVTLCAASHTGLLEFSPKEPATSYYSSWVSKPCMRSIVLRTCFRVCRSSIMIWRLRFGGRISLIGYQNCLFSLESSLAKLSLVASFIIAAALLLL